MSYLKKKKKTFKQLVKFICSPYFFTGLIPVKKQAFFFEECHRKK